MKKISKRCVAAIEQSSFGIGVSTSSRLFFRKYYASRGIDAMKMNNKEMNDVIAADFQKAYGNGSNILHKFKLKDGSVGIFAKSAAFYYLAKMEKGGKITIISVQSAIKEPSEEVRKLRLNDKTWGLK
jgi:hypothetical protein